MKSTREKIKCTLMIALEECPGLWGRRTPNKNLETWIIRDLI